MELIMGDELLNELLGKLAVIARKGLIPAKVAGSTGVGRTLMDALGIDLSSSGKACVGGISITAQRYSQRETHNRVNLFAQVPDWNLSAYKSSREILECFGYTKPGSNCFRLNCTVSGKQPNSQGLFLEVNYNSGLLREMVLRDGKKKPVVTWELSRLKERLLSSHPASLWVKALEYKRDGQVYFQYRECVFTGQPNPEALPYLLESGTITLDHLISDKDGRVSEKGPLFKLKPKNFGLLFPLPRVYDLLSICNR